MLCLVSVPYSRTLLTTHALDKHRDTPSSLLATKIKTLLHCFSYESQYFAATQDISLDTLPGRPNRTLALRTFVVDKISEALPWSSCINEFYAHTVPSSISSVFLNVCPHSSRILVESFDSCHHHSRADLWCLACKVPLCDAQTLASES